MCRRMLPAKPCENFKCLHNLFWEGLRLNREKIKVTERALEIGNCCCLIHDPWSAREIGDAWGLTMGEITRWEAMAWKKIHKKHCLGPSTRASDSPFI